MDLSTVTGILAAVLVGVVLTRVGVNVVNGVTDTLIVCIGSSVAGLVTQAVMYKLSGE